MKRIIILIAHVLLVNLVFAQKAVDNPIGDGSQKILVSPNGIVFEDGEKFIIVQRSGDKDEIIKTISTNVKKYAKGDNLSVDNHGESLIITAYFPGYTKTDKMAGSAYMLNMSNRITIDVKDGRYKVNAPEVVISSEQRYEPDAVILNKGTQFKMTMGIKGKRDVWNSREKKLFIYDEKDKLIEKSTKEKLEKDLSDIIDIITSTQNNDNW